MKTWHRYTLLLSLLLLGALIWGGVVAASPEDQTPTLITPQYATADAVIADYIVTDAPYNADKTGTQDATSAIQGAIDDCAAAGGGTVWLPAGKYKVTGSINVKSFVTLRGDWQDPDVGTSYGTIIMANVPSSAELLPALFDIGGSAGVMGLTVYYPEQDIDDVKPYPFTFYTNGQGDRYMLASVQNCTVINGYRGIGACCTGTAAHEMFTIDNVKGTFLMNAAEVYNQADVGTWKNLYINNKYWANAGAGLAAAPRSKIDAYTRANATALKLGDLEWTEFANIEIEDYKIGIQIVDGKRIQFAGSIYGATVTDCDYALKVDNIDSRWGMVVANSELTGSIASIQNNAGGVVKLAGVTLTGNTSGSGQILVSDETDLSVYTVDYDRTYIKPAAHLYVADLTNDGSADVSAGLQSLLTQAGTTGGVVYLPAGHYKLTNPVSVPAGVELRGASSVPNRDQGGNSSGTLILAYYGYDSDNADTGTALVTLAGNNAGINGVRFLYPQNSPSHLQPTNYAVRGNGTGVYAVNCCIAAAYNGVDFRGCDDHLIKKLVTGCYNNAMAVGDSTGGMIEGCLQNGTVILRNGVEGLVDWPAESEIFNTVFPITRPNTQYITMDGADGETVLNTFAYGVRTLITAKNSNNVLIVNVGADNLGDGKPQLYTDGGSVTGINLMRYNGYSYYNAGTTLKLFNRLTINDKTEPTVDGQAPEPGEPTMMFFNCDSTADFSGVTLETANVKQGTGAWKHAATPGNPVLAIGSFSPVDITYYRNGFLHMWVYCSNINGLGTEGQIEISSSGTSDVNEYAWRLGNYVTKTGWNELWLPMSGAEAYNGMPDFANINYMRIYAVGHSCDFLFDGIEFVHESGYDPEGGGGTEPQPTEPLTLHNCDSIDGISFVARETGNIKEGSGAWRHQHVDWANPEIIAQGGFAAKNGSAYSGGYLHLWVYCDDITKLGHDGQIEITSSGTWDQQEYSWPVSTYVTQTGWNELWLPLASATISGGAPNLSSLNFIRIYSLEHTANFIIDGIELATSMS